MAQNPKKQEAVEIWKNLSKAYDGVRKAHAKNILSHKLTAPQFAVLQVLQESGQVPLKKISQELSVTGANITCVVDNLEKQNLVERIYSKDDRRVILANLTSAGKAKLKSTSPLFLNTLKSSFGKLSENEQKQLIRILGKLAE